METELSENWKDGHPGMGVEVAVALEFPLLPLMRLLFIYKTVEKP